MRENWAKKMVNFVDLQKED